MTKIPTNPRSNCYFGCKGGPLHHFPKLNDFPKLCDTERFNAWKAVLDEEVREKGNDYIYNQLRLCNKHFENCYITSSRMLTRNAIPTLHIKKDSDNIAPVPTEICIKSVSTVSAVQDTKKSLKRKHEKDILSGSQVRVLSTQPSKLMEINQSQSQTALASSVVAKDTNIKLQRKSRKDSTTVALSEDVIGPCKDKKVKKYTWTSASGFSVSVISYGAIIQAIKVPDKHGNVADVVLGFDDLEGYITKNVPYFGATVGRCANRIGGATFDINDVTYHVAKNIRGDHLHGGLVGFDKVNWESSVEGNKVVFSYLSKDGEEGYPGNLLTNVIYEVKDDTLLVKFVATTTKRTVINLTNHSYFNLAGHSAGARELYDHVININADKITETENSIPTGRFIKVGGRLYDLRVPTRLGDRMEKDPKLYDDNFCITNYEKKLNFVSRVFHPYSGRYLEVYSDQPGVQLYTSGGLPGPSEPALIGKNGEGYRRHGAFCLETQNYPDAVHHSNFPTSILSPGEVYVHTVTYTFGVVDERDTPEVINGSYTNVNSCQNLQSLLIERQWICKSEEEE